MLHPTQAIKTVAKMDRNGTSFISVGTGSIRARRWEPDHRDCNDVRTHIQAANEFRQAYGWYGKAYGKMVTGSLGNDTCVHVLTGGDNAMIHKDGTSY